MTIKLILTACIVSFGFTSAQPRVQIEDKAIPSKVNNESQIRENFQNLFDSVSKNETNNSEIFRGILKQEVAKEQQAFDAMKGDILIARIRNSHKKRNFYGRSDTYENFVAVKRETNEKNSSTVSAQNGTTTTVWKNVFHAIKRNNLAAVKQFVEKNSDVVTSTDAEKKSGALLAAELGHLPILEYFLEKNSTLLTVPDRNGNTVFGRAIQKGYLDMVRYLVEVWKMDIHSPSLRIHTAVHVAAREGQLPILKYFVEERKCDVNVPNQNGEPPLFLAAEKPYLHIIMYLIEEGRADPTIIDSIRENILFVSARQGDLTVPRYLLDTKKLNFDINWKNSVGYTIVNWASRFNRTEFVQYMVERKNADVNLEDTKKSRTPLHNAVLKENIALCKFLVEHGAKLDAKDFFDFSPADYATETELSKYLSEVQS